MSWLQGFLSDNLMGFRSSDLPNFIFAVALSGLLTYLLGLISRKSNDKPITSHLMVIGMATTVVITVVRFSLPLSLALLAAMLVIRLRSVTVSLKEFTYLFLAIAIGVGCGSGSTILTAIGFVPIFLVLMISRNKQ